MNWRFTRPGHWVRFEENEPIAFLFPVPRDSVEAFEPRIRSIREEPEVEAQYLKWSRDRAALAERMRDSKPAAPADQWQKSYYRGVDAYDRPGPDDHPPKVGGNPFRRGRGPSRPHPRSGGVPGESRCAAAPA